MMKYDEIISNMAVSEKKVYKLYTTYSRWTKYSSPASTSSRQPPIFPNFNVMVLYLSSSPLGLISFLAGVIGFRLNHSSIYCSPFENCLKDGEMNHKTIT